MSKRVIEFEGFCDQEPGWEFDMPLYMVAPILGYSEGGNLGEAETMVEDYLINRACGIKNEPYEPEDESELRSIRSVFARAKKGTARDGIYYWRRKVEVDDDDLDYSKDLESEELDGHRNSRANR
jgi:hypothetical protein